MNHPDPDASRKGVFMSPRRRVLQSALIPGLLFATMLAAPARAQFYDELRRSLDFSLDAIERSPRLVGMGELTYVGNDPHTAVTLWDFAANPLGILTADTLSTIEIYPGTSSLSGTEDQAGTSPLLERQNAAARESRMGFEVWRRPGGQTAYGFVGDLGQLRQDQPYSGSIERRSTLSQPTVMPILMGRLPYFKTSRLLWSARLFYSGEHTEDQYRGMVQNADGDYIDQNGTTLAPPNVFDPTKYTVQTLGGGFGLGYDRGRLFRAAVCIDAWKDQIQGTNDAARHSTRTHEGRSFTQGQLTFVGRLWHSLDWGVDGRGWRAHSIPGWDVSVDAGIGSVPLVGAGELYDRKEEGTQLRTRLHWTRGRYEVGGGVNTGYRKITIRPPALSDASSYNRFLDLITYRVNADSLVLPDTISASVSAERTWDLGFGLAARVLRDRGLVGLEFHRLRDIQDMILWDQLPLVDGTTALRESFVGVGPLRRAWDVRTGLEYRVSSVLAGRAGYRYRWDDHDAFSEQNEYLGHTMTLGLGVRPQGASWMLDVGYAVTWERADFGSPAAPHGSRQQLASLIRWAF
jgi:hypothetical protein